MNNATEAKKAVSELFQELNRFSLDDYKPISDVESGLKKIETFVKLCGSTRKWGFYKKPNH